MASASSSRSFCTSCMINLRPRSDRLKLSRHGSMYLACFFWLSMGFLGGADGAACFLAFARSPAATVFRKLFLICTFGVLGITHSSGSLCSKSSRGHALRCGGHSSRSSALSTAKVAASDNTTVMSSSMHCMSSVSRICAIRVALAVTAIQSSSPRNVPLQPATGTSNNTRTRCASSIGMLL